MATAVGGTWLTDNRSILQLPPAHVVTNTDGIVVVYMRLLYIYLPLRVPRPAQVWHATAFPNPTKVPARRIASKQVMKHARDGGGV